MNQVEWLSIRCGELVSRFPFDLHKPSSAETRQYLHMTPLVVEKLWIQTEGVPYRAVAEVCAASRAAVKVALGSSGDLSNDSIQEIAEAQLYTCSCLWRPFHDLFYLGYALGAYARWPSRYEDVATARETARKMVLDNDHLDTVRAVCEGDITGDFTGFCDLQRNTDLVPGDAIKVLKDLGCCGPTEPPPGPFIGFGDRRRGT